MIKRQDNYWKMVVNWHIKTYSLCGHLEVVGPGALPRLQGAHTCTCMVATCTSLPPGRVQMCSSKLSAQDFVHYKDVCT